MNFDLLQDLLTKFLIENLPQNIFLADFVTQNFDMLRMLSIISDTGWFVLFGKFSKYCARSWKNIKFLGDEALL